MTTIHGFELVRETDIPEINTRARVFRHVRTGAELISMENDDENKVFGISFATPPTNSTGLPHILEHSVLGGSRKYPVKEPFVELLKGSLNTFLNAFTFPDKTCYPVASQNLKDFYNLVDVYLDAVFYPRITPETLQQEGWHYELDNLDDPLVYKGVVFNEMKGAYSSPDSVLTRNIQQSLLPDTTYGVDSGGDPTVIPELTYEEFRDFHDTYYHPSNARIWFYGDDDPDTRLKLVDEFITEFEKITVEPKIELQPAFAQPRRVEQHYAASDGEDALKAYVTVSWVLPETINTELALALTILNHILIHTPASPLRKTLIESGLGEDLTGMGFESDLRQMIFGTGLKGVALKNVDMVETLILDTLEQLTQDGIESEMIEAAINTIEFQLRENNTGRFPRGLALMIIALRTWLYQGDPLAHLAFEAPLNDLKAQLKADSRYFEGLIRQYLLDNPHRLTAVLKPDTGLQQRVEAEEQEKLAQIRAGMNKDQITAILADTQKLKKIQETPDSPEALATIPMLGLADLEKTNKVVPLETYQHDGSQVLYHDLFTNGILYLDVGVDLRALPQALVPYAGLLGRMLLEMGTESEDFVKLSQRIGRKTGGISPDIFAAAARSPREGATWSFLRGKATVAQADDLLAILRDVLLTARLDNKERLSQIALEAKAELEAGLVPAGHRVVNTRLRALFTEADWVQEQTRGINQLFFLRKLVERMESDWGSVLADLEALRKAVINRSALICNVTLDRDNWLKFEPKLAAFIASLPASPVTKAQWSLVNGAAHQGLTIPAQVNYVGKGGNLFDVGYQLHGSAHVISKYLRTTWLWERVRVHGGAYGGFCMFDQQSGVFTYLSYRDPNLLQTLDNYDGAAKYLRELALSEDELTKGIIGAIGELDSYQLPDAKGYSSMARYLVGYDDEQRQKIRDEMLSTTVKDFRTFGEVLEAMNPVGQVVVLGGKDDIDKANSERGGFLDVTKVL